MSSTWRRMNAQMATPEIRWNAHASIPSPPRYCRYRTGRLASVVGRGRSRLAVAGLVRVDLRIVGGRPGAGRAASAACATAEDTSRGPIGSRPAPPDAGATVKIQEADAKSLLAAQGLPVPPWAVARTPAEARAAAERFLADGAGRVVIKAQVLVGGRGKAGGGKLAGSPAEAEEVAGRILGMEIKGIPVRKVLVGPAAVIVKEFYLGAILDRASRRIVLLASAEGGVEIAEVAKATVEAHPLLGLLDWQARELAFAVGLAGPHLRDFVKIARGLVATMRANDADLVEVNPLAIIRESGPQGPVERIT